MEQLEKVKRLAKEGNKQRAMIALKHKKFMEKELEKVEGAELVLQQAVQGIEQAQQDVNVF